jgi:hypothetical protein
VQSLCLFSRFLFGARRYWHIFADDTHSALYVGGRVGSEQRVAKDSRMAL